MCMCMFQFLVVYPDEGISLRDMATHVECLYTVGSGGSTKSTFYLVQFHLGNV